MPTTALQVGGGPGSGNTPNLSYWNDSATTQVDAGSFTFGGWYKATTEGTGAMQILRMDIVGTSARIIVDRNYTNNKWVLQSHDGTSSSNQDSSSLTAAGGDTDEWHHVAITCDSSNGVKLYIDAVEVAYNTRDMSPLDGLDVDQVTFGSERNLNEALVAAQNATVYDGVLTPAEIAEMMLETPPATIGGHAQLGYYEGTATNDPFTDLSSNGADAPGFASGWTPVYVSATDLTYPTAGDNNQAPSANAGGDQTVGRNQQVTLDSTGSWDLEMQPLTFTWSQDSGPAVTLSDVNAAQPTFTPTVTGTYVFELEVSDGELTDTDTVTITVSDNNPVAEAGPSQVVAPGDVVTLDATGSTDPNDDALTYTWSQTSGTSVTLSDANAAQPTFTAPAAPATLVFEVEADDGSLTGTDSVTVTVVTPTEVPNTMKLGVNLRYCTYFDETFHFKDLWKRAERWRRYPTGSSTATGRYELDDPDVDADGYPTSIASGTYAGALCWFGIDTPESELAWHEGVWHIYHDGTGTWELGTNAAPDNLTYVEPGHYTFTIDPGERIQTLQIRITATSASPNHLRNFRVVHEDDLLTYETQPWRQQFLDSVQEVTNGVLRYMDLGETNNSEVEVWGDRSTMTRTWGQGRGIPYEMMCDLSNRLQRDAWFCVPHAADDNYVTEMARVIRDELDPSLRAYIEYSNETWNSQFDQTDYVRDTGLADPDRFGTTRWRAGNYYTAARSVEIFNIFETEFGGLSRLRRVLPGQSASTGVGNNVLSFESAHQHADVYTIAPYVGGRFGRGSGVQQLQNENWDVARLITEMHVDIAEGGTIRNDVQANMAIANSYNLPIVCYEGGQHLVGTGTYQNDTDLEELFKNANRDPLMQPLARAYCQMLQDEGIEELAWFSHMSVYSKFGSWGLQEHYGMDPRPKYDNAIEWIAGNTNTAPQASAGADQSVQTGVTGVTLDATGSTDANDDDLTYTWSQDSGTAVTLSDVNAAQPTFTAPGSAGTLVFRVTVSDGQATDFDTVTVTVTNPPSPPSQPTAVRLYNVAVHETDLDFDHSQDISTDTTFADNEATSAISVDGAGTVTLYMAGDGEAIVLDLPANSIYEASVTRIVPGTATGVKVYW